MVVFRYYLLEILNGSLLFIFIFFCFLSFDNKTMPKCPRAMYRFYKAFVRAISSNSDSRTSEKLYRMCGYTFTCERGQVISVCMFTCTGNDLCASRAERLH